MAALNVYASPAELRERLGHQPSGINDGIIDQVLEAASRRIDGLTDRRFYVVTDTRHYTAEASDVVFVDDVGFGPTVKTDEDGDRVYETVWASTDFELEPFNASDDNRPFTRIRTTPNGTQTFPRTRRGVEVVGSFGFGTSPPDDIVEACLLLAVRLYQRKNAPFGVAGSTELGQATLMPHRDDPDIKVLVAPYRRMGVGVI